MHHILQRHIWDPVSGEIGRWSKGRLLDLWDRGWDLFEKDLDRLPLWSVIVFASGIGGYFLLRHEPSLQWTLMALMAAGGVRYWAGKSLEHIGFIVALNAILLLIAGFAVAKIRSDSVFAPRVVKQINNVMVTGTLLEISGGNDGRPRLLIAPEQISRLEQSEIPKKIRVRYLKDVSGLLPGDRLRFRASLMSPPQPAIPGGFDFGRKSWFEQVGSVGYVMGGVEKVTGGEADRSRFGFKKSIAKLRRVIFNRVLANSPDESAGMAAALITGDRSALQPHVVQALRDTSLAHLLAISGLHMGLIAWSVFGIVRLAIATVPRLALRWNGKKIAAWVSLFGATVYLGISGGAVATQRAYIMVCLVLIAILVDRPALTMRTIMIAAFAILFFTPESLLSPGFQMSFAASTVLIASAEWWRRRRIRVSNERPSVFNFERSRARMLLSRSGDYLWGIVTTSVLAGLATAPFAIFHFNHLANYGAVANLIAMPLMGLVIMPSAIFALVLMPFGLEMFPLAVMNFGIDLVITSSEEIASWKGAAIVIHMWPLWSLVAITVGGLWLVIWQEAVRWVALPVIAIGIIGGILNPSPDVFIDREGRNVAVLDEDGKLYPLYARRSKFSIAEWQKAVGDFGKPESGVKSGRFTCDTLGCLYRREGGKSIAYIIDPHAFEEDCWRADLIITPLSAPWLCQRGGATVIDMWDIRDGGAHSFRFSGGGVIVRSVKEERGKRPWSN